MLDDFDKIFLYGYITGLIVGIVLSLTLLGIDIKMLLFSFLKITMGLI